MKTIKNMNRALNLWVSNKICNAEVRRRLGTLIIKLFMLKLLHVSIYFSIYMNMYFPWKLGKRISRDTKQIY